jgi:NDP-sugar pyrophosphorylase family protein
MPNNKTNRLSKIPVAILCGGKGTRLYPDTKTLPKPLVKVSDKPIIVHIINHYLSYGLKNFYLALGYKSEKFHDFFSKNKSLFDKDVNINLIDTGEDSMTGGRVLRLEKELSEYDEFMLTYGDGLSDINLTILEQEPLENLSKDKELAGYKHFKFWQCMDTPRDRQLLEEYLKSKNS